MAVFTHKTTVTFLTVLFEDAIWAIDLLPVNAATRTRDAAPIRVTKKYTDPFKIASLESLDPSRAYQSNRETPKLFS